MLEQHWKTKLIWTQYRCIKQSRRERAHTSVGLNGGLELLFQNVYPIYVSEKRMSLYIRNQKRYFEKQRQNSSADNKLKLYGKSLKLINNFCG